MDVGWRVLAQWSLYSVYQLYSGRWEAWCWRNVAAWWSCGGRYNEDGQRGTRTWISATPALYFLFTVDHRDILALPAVSLSTALLKAHRAGRALDLLTNVRSMRRQPT